MLLLRRLSIRDVGNALVRRDFGLAVRITVSAGVILIHFVGVKMTHLGEDGGFLAADDADPGAGSGDQGIRPSRRGNSGDRKAAWLFA
jgi:hypothetical protein